MRPSVDSLLDLSALTDRADRLVKAARAAGADAADAVAVRSMSLAIEVRDGVRPLPTSMAQLHGG